MKFPFAAAWGVPGSCVVSSKGTSGLSRAHSDNESNSNDNDNDDSTDKTISYYMYPFEYEIGALFLPKHPLEPKVTPLGPR